MDDTNNFAEHLHTAEDDLMKAGFTNAQARAFTEAVCKLNSGLVSKSDLKSDLRVLRSELENKIEQSARKSLFQFMGLNLGLVAVVVAVVKLVPGLG